MKKYLVPILTAALLVVASKVSAQSYQTLTASNGVTAFLITASTATNLDMVIDTSKQQTVCVQITSTNTAAGTGGQAGSYIFRYQRSNDGVRYDTALDIAASPIPNGTSALSWSTNINANGAQYIKIPYMTNAMASGTNVFVTIATYYVKPPGQFSP